MSGQSNTYVSAKIGGSPHGLQFQIVQIRQALYTPCQIELTLAFKTNELDDAYNKATSSWLGDILEVSFKDKDDSSIEKKYQGTITSVSLTEDGIILHAQSEDHLLTLGRKHRLFVEMQAHDVVNTIVKGSGLKNDVKGPSGSIKFKFLHQFGETDADFLRRLARFDGCVFFHDGEKFVYSDKLGGRENVKLERQHVSKVALECNLGLNKWKGTAYDSEKHLDPGDLPVESGNYSSPAHPFVSSTYQKSQKVYKDAVEEVYHEAITNKGEFERFLKNQQSLNAGKFVQIAGETNNPMVAIGRTIKCDDHAILKNSAVITGLVATFRDSGYNATFQAVAEGTVVNSPQVVDQHQTPTLLQPAVVKDNKDPQNLGRVHIQYLWDSDGGALAWARMVQAGAGGTGGASYGTHFIPRIGDQVFVSCENGNPSMPVVFGAMYHSESKPDFVTDNGSEEVLVVKTPGESTIRVIDKEGSEEIVVSMKGDKNLIRLELKQPKITVESVDGTILVHSKTIQFKADEKIEMNAQSIEMKTDKDFKLEAQGNANIKATQNCAMEATGSVSVKSTQSCTIEGTTGTTVKNGMGAQIAMSGPSVNVNNGALEVM